MALSRSAPRALTIVFLLALLLVLLLATPAEAGIKELPPEAVEAEAGVSTPEEVAKKRAALGKKRATSFKRLTKEELAKFMAKRDEPVVEGWRKVKTQHHTQNEVEERIRIVEDGLRQEKESEVLDAYEKVEKERMKKEKGEEASDM